MGMGVPLLNEYKRSFLFKRIPQTVLGGLKVKLGYDAPPYVYAQQIVLWLVPLLLGCIFTLVIELAYTDLELVDFLLLYSCLYGACITIFVVVVQTISTVVEMKEKENRHTGPLRKKNILADEDEIEFESCCGAETLAFVIPPKRFKVNIALHALLSGAVCGFGFWYLLPYSLNKLYYYNYGATAVIYIVGWLTICIAQYSLTTAAPPEPAIYRTMDTYEMLPLTRPLYTLICYSIHIANWYHSEFFVANQALHILFILLPLLWFSGLLPPAEVLVLWTLEQFHVFLLGGSPAASNPRLVMNVVLSTGAFLGCYFLSSCFSSVVLAATTGYLLSCDLGALGTQIWSACTKNNKNRVSSARPAILASTANPHPAHNGFLWSWCWSTVLYHVVMLALVATAAGVTNYFADSISSDAAKYLGYCIIALCVVEKITRDIQSVYVFVGMWRNALFPHSTENVRAFKQVKRRLLVFGIVRRILVNWVSPLLMVVYLSLRVVTPDVMEVSVTEDKSTALGVFYVFGVVRAFRWAWQSTTHALLEMSVVHIILTVLTENSDVLNFGAPLLLLFAGVTRDRLFQISNKIFYVIALMITSWTDKKQRRSSTAPIIFLNIIFFPIVLAFIVAASAISAPVLCLFTLPLFFIGYPRPVKFWAEPVGSSASTCPDTLYYRQLSLELAKALRSSFANGSLGEPQVGNHYLMRFQDRMVWTMILERGAGYCTVSIKGLELQETSCHTTEAARIDDQYANAFEGKSDDNSLCSCNNYPLHCLTPVDAAEVKTYSDAKNILTGVIDSPDSVGVTLSFFAKSLVWVLLHHINQIKKREEAAKKLKESEISSMEEMNQMSGGGDRKDKFAKDGNKRRDKVSVVNNNTAPKELNHNVAASKKKREGNPLHANSGDSFVLPPINGNKNLVHDSRPASRDSESSRKISLSSSLHSFTDSIWSDDFDPEKGKKKAGSQRKDHKVSTVVSITNKSSVKAPSPHSVLTSLPPLTANRKASGAFNDSGNGKDLDDFLNDSEFGLPAVDVSTSHTRPNIDFNDAHRMEDNVGAGKSLFSTKPTSKFMVPNGNHIYKPIMNLAGSPDFKCQYSTHMSVPMKWRELPIEPSQLSRYMSQFPSSWYKHTLNTLDWSVTGQPGHSVAAEVGSDDALTNCYSQLVMACYSAFDAPGRPSGASYLYKSYNGDVPWNAMMDWLSEDKELYKLVIKAFRFGFKLMLDQTLLGDISDNEELEECLRSYDTEWYIGRETDSEWGAAVMENRPNLFSLGHNLGQGTYTSRTLSLQDVMVHMGRINRESVTGQWSNLNLELLYMTNDDEERYSIQAQPAMLRNLTVQAADPPLGYPIYSSPPISVPTL